MKKLQNLSIKWQIIILGIILVTVPVVTTGIWSYTSSEKEVFRFVEEKLKEQIAMIVNHLETATDLTQQKINSDLNVAHDILYSYGFPLLNKDLTISMEITDQITQRSHHVKIPMMTINDEPLAHNHGIVDKIQSLVGGTTTIFQMIPEGALRISTNVLNDDGVRAVGTYIPTTSPVYQAVMRGETFSGRAYVVNAWYQTAYEPITDRQGKVVGMLYVGVRDASEAVLDGLAEIVVGKTGYTWIINLQGEYILSLKRERDGENISESKDNQGRAFIQEWIRKAPSLEHGETIIDYYSWQNRGENTPRTKVAAYTYFPKWEWIIGASAYVEDFQDSLKKIKTITILVSCIAIVIGSIVAYLVALLMIAPLFKSVAFARAIAKGNLTTQIDIQQKNEIGTLAKALSTMQQTIRSVLQEIEGLIQDVHVGKLASRGSAEGFDGGWRELVSGVNNIMREIEKSVAEAERQKTEVEFQKTEIEQQSWVKDGVSQLNVTLAGDHSLVEICNKAISFAARYVEAGQGVVYTYNEEKETLHLNGSYAFTERDGLSNHYKIGEGIIGQVALERSPIQLKHLSHEDRLIHTATISEVPLATYTFPLIYNEGLYGVLELASFEAFDEKALEFIQQTNSLIATALFSAIQRERGQELLQLAQHAAQEAEEAKEEAQRQTVEAQRVNAQMEEQQQQLQQQNEEFQQLNAQLKEQQQQFQQEIKEREQAQKTLAEERNLIQKLVDILPDYIYVKDRNSRFILANRTLAVATGFSAVNELLGKTDFDIHPKELAEQFYEYEQGLMQSNQRVQDKEEVVEDQQAGKKIWLLTTKIPFQDQQGNIAGFIGVGRNITDLKRAEEALQKLKGELKNDEA